MQLFYKEYPGPGKTLVIMHGLFGMLDNWHNIARQLSQHYRAIVPDLRNHGQSPHSNEMSYRLMAEDLRELLDNIGVKSAYIMGHSLGGKVAMEFALTYPQMTEKLIVVDMSPVKYKPGHDQIFKALFALDLSDAGKKRSEFDAEMARMIPDFGVRQFLMKSLGRDEDGYSWKFNLDALHDNYSVMLEAIEDDRKYSGPVMFIRGGRSPYVDGSHKDAIENLFPDYRIVTVDGAGHWVHADKPAELIKELESFLSE